MVTEWVMLVGSSLWLFLPLISHDSYAYVSTFLSSKEFLSFFINKYPFLGLSLVHIIAIIILPLLIFIPKTKKNTIWILIHILYIIGMTCILMIGKTGYLPSLIGKFQITRTAPYIGISLSFLLGYIIHRMWVTRHSVLRGSVVILLFVLIYQSIEYSSIFVPTIGIFEDPVYNYMTKNPSVPLKTHRILPSDIGSTSLALLGYGKFSTAYMSHMESNFISSRLSALAYYQDYPSLIPKINLDRFDSYMKATATKYVMFEEYSPLGRSIFAAGLYKDLKTAETNNKTFHMFEVPWEIQNAYIVPIHQKPSIEQFIVNYDIVQSEYGQRALDHAVSSFSQALFDPMSVPVSVDYPTQTTLQLSIPYERPSNTIVLLESYSKGFEATFDGIKLPVKRSGPNFIQLELPPTTTGFPVVVTLTHRFTNTFYIITVTFIVSGLFASIYDAGMILRVSKNSKTNPILKETIIVQP